MSWNTATKYSDTQRKQKWVIPAKPSPHSNYTKKTIFIPGTCIHKQLAANKEAWVPISRLKEKDTTKYFKYKINQMFLKLNMQTREHGWLCKWNHKQAYQCLPIIKKLSWVLLPRVKFWSKDIHKSTIRRTTWPNDVETRKVIQLKILSMLYFVLYIKSG